MIESALCNCFIISSNCKNGPKEFLLNGDAGLIFESNKNEEFLKNYVNLKTSNKIYLKKKLLAKKNSMNFTMFRHYLNFKNIIDLN